MLDARGRAEARPGIAPSSAGGGSYRLLDVWNISMELVDECYRLTRLFPVAERYGLSSQLQRAAVSIPANIAEGHGRKGTGEWGYHVSVARGSIYEVETLLMIAKRQDYLTSETGTKAWELSQRVGKMLSRLLQSKSIIMGAIRRASSIEHRASK